MSCADFSLVAKQTPKERAISLPIADDYWLSTGVKMILIIIYYCVMPWPRHESFC